MNIEQKINELIDQVNLNRSSISPTFCYVHTWNWHPAVITWSRDLTDSPEEEEVLNRAIGKDAYVEYKAIQLIKTSDDTECLTSPIEFIRKTKEWFINERKTTSD